MFNAIILAFNVLWALLCVHYVHSVRHGAFQRRALMVMCETSDQLAAVRGLFDAHIWRVATFRNPWTVYPPILHSLIARLSQ